jgi:hypothetical protein
MPRVQHVVLFRFRPGLSAAEEAELVAMVRGWPADIGGFRTLRFGRDTSGRAAGWEWLLLQEFDDEATLRAYQDHPAHQRFVGWIKDHGRELIAFDYPLDAESSIDETGP